MAQRYHQQLKIIGTCLLSYRTQHCKCTSDLTNRIDWLRNFECLNAGVLFFGDTHQLSSRGTVLRQSCGLNRVYDAAHVLTVMPLWLQVV